MRMFLIMVAVIILFVVLAPFWFILSLIRKLYRDEDMDAFYKSIALSIDQLGGTIIYGTVDWTISGYTYILHDKGNKYATMFMEFIDYLAYRLTNKKDHCARTYRHELNNHKNGGI